MGSEMCIRDRFRTTLCPFQIPQDSNGNKSSQRPHSLPRRIWSGSGGRNGHSVVRNRELERKWLPERVHSETAYVRQNLTGTSLFKDASVVKIFVRRYKPNCGKNALSRNVEESFKKFWIRIRRRMTFQNLTTSSFSTNTSRTKFSCRSDQYSLHAKLLTDRQTNDRRVKQASWLMY